MKRSSCRSGFSLVEVLVIVAIVIALAAVFLRPAGRPPKAGRIKCVNNLKNVGLAFRIFATDNGDNFPGALIMSNTTDVSSVQIEQVYAFLTNELSTPKILHCPSDTQREEAENFRSFSSKNASYFASLSASEMKIEAFLAGDRNIQIDGKLASRVVPLTSNTVASWSKDIHIEQGNVVMGDGSVQQMSSSRLKNSLRDLGSATNYLVFP
jgi:hypothetical protein